MPQPIPHPTLPPTPARTVPATSGGTALRRAAARARDGWARASAALARAEQHIMENFRQPPHGG